VRRYLLSQPLHARPAAKVVGLARESASGLEVWQQAGWRPVGVIDLMLGGSTGRLSLRGPEGIPWGQIEELLGWPSLDNSPHTGENP
jgi:hypothetical protein